MKTFFLCVCSFAVSTVLMFCLAGGATTEPQGAVAPNTISSGDVGTDLVASFYTALLQENEPTLAQEQVLFNTSSGIKVRLMNAGKGTDKDPVMLKLYRKHKDLFFPANAKKLNVPISSTFNWVRDLDHIREHRPAGNGQVIVIFPIDVKAGAVRRRTILFSFTKGKLDSDDIVFGDDNNSAAEREELQKEWEAGK